MFKFIRPSGDGMRRSGKRSNGSTAWKERENRDKERGLEDETRNECCETRPTSAGPGRSLLVGMRAAE